MTERWSEQQQEQYRRVRDGFVKTGFSKDVAEAQARRTIEARRRMGEPMRRSAEPTKDDLYREAMRFNITGRSKMDKDELAKAVEAHRSGHLDD